MADVTNSMILQALRNAAWGRAKGELLGILEMYYGDRDDFDELATAFEEFIARVEDNGLGGLA